MNGKQKSSCRKIIHGAATSGAAAAAAMAQAPGADIPVLVGIEITMVIALGSVFEVSLSEASAKALVLTYAATMAGRGISQGLFGWILIAGNVLNSTTAFTIIEVMGWAIAKDFANDANRDRAY